MRPFRLASASILIFCQPVYWCQENGGSSILNNGSTEAVSRFTRVVYDRFMSYSESLSEEISQHLGFCVKDPEMDWNAAFIFSANLGFLGNCIEETNGDITFRLCTAAEIKFYFSSFFINGGRKTT